VSSLGAGLVKLGAEPGKKVEADEGEGKEVYSDPEDGVEIVDMDDVRQMDWMAPETLRKEREGKSAKKAKIKIKAESAGDECELGCFLVEVWS
jgi:DNA-directed RNA polymerase III subunit RPC4